MANGQLVRSGQPVWRTHQAEPTQCRRVMGAMNRFEPADRCMSSGKEEGGCHGPARLRGGHTYVDAIMVLLGRSTLGLIARNSDRMRRQTHQATTHCAFTNPTGRVATHSPRIASHCMVDLEGQTGECTCAPQLDGCMIERQTPPSAAEAENGSSRGEGRTAGGGRPWGGDGVGMWAERG